MLQVSTLCLSCTPHLTRHSGSLITPLRYTAPWKAEEALKLREQVDYLRSSESYSISAIIKMYCSAWFSQRTSRALHRSGRYAFRDIDRRCTDLRSALTGRATSVLGMSFVLTTLSGASSDSQNSGDTTFCTAHRSFGVVEGKVFYLRRKRHCSSGLFFLYYFTLH